MKILEGQPGKAINELDKTLAFLGLLFSLILTIWLAITTDRPIYVIVGILSFLACAGYLLIRRNLYLSAIPLCSANRSQAAVTDFTILYSRILKYIMLQAMACGTLVLATPVARVPGLTQHGESGFIMENNAPKSITGNVIRSLNHPNLEETTKNARTLIEKEFTYEKAVERYSTMFALSPQPDTILRLSAGYCQIQSAKIVV